MYYTNEFSHEKFKTYEECVKDLLTNMDCTDYAKSFNEMYTIEEVISAFLSTPGEFLNYFSDIIDKIIIDMGCDYIFGHEEEE